MEEEYGFDYLMFSFIGGFMLMFIIAVIMLAGKVDVPKTTLNEVCKEITKMPNTEFSEMNNGKIICKEIQKNIVYDNGFIILEKLEKR